MSFSMSQASLPAVETSLNALSGVLDKGAAFAAAKKIDPSVLLTSRLAPDMFALTRQVQVATDLAKNGVARLAGVEPPRFEDNETTIEQLKARIAKALAFIKTVDPGFPSQLTEARVASSAWIVRFTPLTPGSHTLVVSDTIAGDPFVATFHINVTHP